MKLSRSHLQPPRAQFSLSMNVTVFRSAPTANCLVAVKGQVAKLFESTVCCSTRRPRTGFGSGIVRNAIWGMLFFGYFFSFGSFLF